jgi:hypothetical protein
MSISGVSSAASNAALQRLFQQRNQDLASLESAVQSGNIATAQQSLTTLQQDTQTIQSTLDPTGDQSTNSSTTGSSSQNSFASDLAGLLQAVQSGDIATARQDATAVQNDMQSTNSSQAPATSGHHHHHHHAAATTDTSSSDAAAGDVASSTSSGDPTSDTSSSGTLALVLELYNSTT